MPKGWYNRIFLNFNVSYSRLLSRINPVDKRYQRSEINVNSNIQTKKLSWVGIYMAYNPHQNDFYEPRWQGWFFRRGASVVIDGWFESNSAKKYSFYTENAFRKYFDFYNAMAMDLNLRQTYRFSSKFSLTQQLNLMPRINSMGYAWSENGNEIIFSRRKINTVENILSIKYNFNNKMGVTFRARHYMSSVKNKEFFTLGHDGKLNRNSAFNQNVDRSANFFNIDMVYTWEFAPGSFLNIVWKNAVYDFKDQVEKGYFKNFNNTMEADQNNNLSLKVIYFLDYLQLKYHKKKKINS